MTSRVTTGHGDGGFSRSLGGESLPKSHRVMEAVGATDEFRAQVALVRQLVMRDRPDDHETETLLRWIMTASFPIGTECSDPGRLKPTYRAVELTDRHLAHLEAEQARMEACIVWPNAFISGASNALAAQADLAATAARVLERRMVALRDDYPDFHGEVLLPFVNRLSDTLYVLARFLEDGVHDPVDYGLLGE
jgi:cob(I)alamin adenosyltransferase